jgi:hypothetical protein
MAWKTAIGRDKGKIDIAEDAVSLAGDGMDLDFAAAGVLEAQCGSSGLAICVTSFCS